MRRAGNRSKREPMVSAHTGVRGCGGKRCYGTFTVADRLATRMRRQLDAAEVSAYKCRHCGWWHIGSD